MRDSLQPFFGSSGSLRSFYVCLCNNGLRLVNRLSFFMIYSELDRVTSNPKLDLPK